MLSFCFLEWRSGKVGMITQQNSTIGDCNFGTIPILPGLGIANPHLNAQAAVAVVRSSCPEASW